MITFPTFHVSFAASIGVGRSFTMGKEVENSSDGQKTAQSPSVGESLLNGGWNALQHVTGISTIKAVFHTEKVENALHDFQLIDDGTSGFNDLARQHVDKTISGTQRKNLEDEREHHGWGLVFSAVPLPGMPDTPDKGPLMKQFDEKVDDCVKEAKQRVERGMTSDEMKQLHDEKSSYWWSQVANDTTLGLWPGSATKGPMMLEYEKRVAKVMEETGVSWQDKNS
jgi:hypothetical protein